MRSSSIAWAWIAYQMPQRWNSPLLIVVRSSSTVRPSFSAR